MRKDAPKPLSIAPLQIAAVEIVTDPAELAEVERLRERLKRKQRRPKVPLHFAPLQIAPVEIVTDPAELAEVERMCKRLKQKRARPKPNSKRSGANASVKPAAKKKR